MAQLPENVLHVIASTHVVACVMACVCTQWGAAKNSRFSNISLVVGDMPKETERGGDQDASFSTWMRKTIQLLEEDHPNLRFLHLDLPTWDSKLSKVLSGRFQQLHKLVLMTGGCDTGLITSLPGTLQSLQIDFCVYSFRLNCLNHMSGLLSLELCVSNHETYILGDFRLSALSRLRIEDMQHQSAVIRLYAPDLSLRFIPDACIVDIADVIVAPGVTHPSCVSCRPFRINANTIMQQLMPRDLLSGN